MTKKKLIEVAIPLEAINAASVREKSIRHGHPSTLHLWWARRPLATCRAVLFAQLVDDPSSHPDKFPSEEAVEKERKRLFRIIEDLVKWENSTNEEVLERARTEIKNSCEGELPTVYDPFSGGGSIPLEAQRLGLPACGSDLNPIAVMVGKAMIEIPPRFKDVEPIHPGIKERNHYRNAEGLAEDVKYYGEWIRERAIERIGHLYPSVKVSGSKCNETATVIAWIWARTLPSPDPAFSDMHVPIASSFLLSSTLGAQAWIEPIVDRARRNIVYKVRHGGTSSEIARAKKGTKAGRGANFNCIVSSTAITPDYVKRMGSSGKMSEELIAIVAEGDKSRIYLEPSAEHAYAARSAKADWKPDIPLPGDMRAFWTPPYGLKTFGDLFTERQLVALNTFSGLVNEAKTQVMADAAKSAIYSDSERSLSDGGSGRTAYAEAVCVYLAFIVDKCADYWSSVCTWNTSRQIIRNTFGRQAIPMTWDFAEANPFSSSTGNWTAMKDWVWKAIAGFVPSSESSVIQHDAQSLSYQPGTVISTDPPYYDNIGYADLSDFFFAWMKPLVRQLYPAAFSVLVTPKAEELIAAPYRHGGKEAAELHFMSGMKSVVENMVSQCSEDFPATIYYAFKQSEIQQEGISSKGWSAFLEAVVGAGYCIVGTWPLRTEMASRMIASGTNALANSVVLVCRKKELGASTITRAEFIRALKKELPKAIEELQAASVSPADMPQSAIGPGMGVFSRYASILEADDSVMTVKTALQLINKELDEFLSDLHGEFDAETRFATTWFEQNGYTNGDYGPADNLARARGISVESVRHAGIIDSSAGKVRILKRSELDTEWDPNTDPHLTIWECCQYVVRAYREGGEFAAALLIKKMGFDKADAVKDLAYFLYDVCSNKQKDAEEATAYNGLIAVWSDLTKLAATIQDTDTSRQSTMDI